MPTVAKPRCIGSLQVDSHVCYLCKCRFSTFIQALHRESRNVIWDSRSSAALAFDVVVKIMIGERRDDVTMSDAVGGGIFPF